MALFTMLYHYLSRSRYTQKKEKHLILYHMQRNFLLKDIFEQFVRSFFLINSEFILRVC